MTGGSVPRLLRRRRSILVGLALVAVLLGTVPAVASGAAATNGSIQATSETAGNGTAAETASATLGNPTVWTAPGGAFANLTAPADVWGGMRTDPITSRPWLTRNRSIAKGDTVAFSIEAPGLVEAVATADEDTPERAFLTVLNRSERYDFRMNQTATVDPRPMQLDPSRALRDGALEVVADPANRTLFVALDTGRLRLDRGSETVPIRAGETYWVTITAGTGPGSTAATATWDLVPRRLSFDGEDRDRPVGVEFGHEYTSLQGDTNVAPGTDLELVLDPRRPGAPSITTTTRVHAESPINSRGHFHVYFNTTRLTDAAAADVGAEGFDATLPVVHAPRWLGDNTPVRNVTVWTAPTERYGDLTSAAAVHHGRRDGWLVRSRTVAVEDTAVFAVRAPELVARLNDSNSTTAAFARLVNRSDTYAFRMEQPDGTTTTHAPQKGLDLSETLAADGLRVITDGPNGTLYVALRTDRASMDPGGRWDRVRSGDVYGLELTRLGVDLDGPPRVSWQAVSTEETAESGPEASAAGGPSDSETTTDTATSIQTTDPSTTVVTEPTDDGTETPPATTTTADGPGFGPTVAALALVVLPLVARKRY